MEHLEVAPARGMNPLGAVAISAALWLGAFGGALAWALGADPIETIGCFVPALAVALLGLTSQVDRRQYVARLFAAGMFGSIGLLMWSSSHDHAGLWLLGFLAVLVVVFLLWLLWLARFTTRIRPMPGAQPCAGEALVRRLGSLRLPGWHVGAAKLVGPGRWQMDVTTNGEARSHRIALAIDERRREVGVREYLGASGAAPRDRNERSMRGPGDPYFDPTRPDAQRVWARTWQATMVVPEELAAARIEFSREGLARAELSEAVADRAVTLLAAIVTRSGFAWQPRLLGSEPGG